MQHPSRGLESPAMPQLVAKLARGVRVRSTGALGTYHWRGRALAPGRGKRGGGVSAVLVMAGVGSGSSCAAPAAVQQLPAPALPRSRSPLLVSGVLRGGGRGRLVGVVGKKRARGEEAGWRRRRRQRRRSMRMRKRRLLPGEGKREEQEEGKVNHGLGILHVRNCNAHLNTWCLIVTRMT